MAHAFNCAPILNPDSIELDPVGGVVKFDGVVVARLCDDVPPSLMAAFIAATERAIREWCSENGRIPPPC